MSRDVLANRLDRPDVTLRTIASAQHTAAKVAGGGSDPIGVRVNFWAGRPLLSSFSMSPLQSRSHSLRAAAISFLDCWILLPATPLWRAFTELIVD